MVMRNSERMCAFYNCEQELRRENENGLYYILQQMVVVLANVSRIGKWQSYWQMVVVLASGSRIGSRNKAECLFLNCDVLKKNIDGVLSFKTTCIMFQRINTIFQQNLQALQLNKCLPKKEANEIVKHAYENNTLDPGPPVTFIDPLIKIASRLLSRAGGML